MFFRGIFRAARLAKQLSPVVCTRTITPRFVCQARCFSSSSEDFELLEVLDNEIRYEKEELQTATSRIMEGFTMKASGSQVYLTKKYGVETIKISLNVNEMVELTPDEDDPEDKPPVYLPHFTISVVKEGHGELVFSCTFEMANAEGQGEYEYIVSSVKFVKNGDSSDLAYYMDFGNLDTNLIGQFEQYLDRRDLGSGFSEQLLEFSNAFEGDNYLQFLENVRDFI